MLLWYIAPSIVAVHDIFRSRGLDYRLIGFGALAPLLIDAPLGHEGHLPVEGNDLARVRLRQFPPLP